MAHKLPKESVVTKRNSLEQIAAVLTRIAETLEAGRSTNNEHKPVIGETGAYHWDAASDGLLAVPKVSRVPIELLKGIDDARDTLLQNTLQFARGHGANNALLWGARGMGKSSLVKAIHAHVAGLDDPALHRLILIEINREDIESLPRLMRSIATNDARFIIFCDDLSFDRDESSYKALKSILDGGLEGRPENVLFYATSNRRHLMPRDMIDNERATAITPGEAVDEKISLSDRFGLWLGFHNCDQPTFLAMVRSYADAYGIAIADDALYARAIEWAAIRGSRSGRVAIQFVRSLAGEMGRVV
jgi:predicted AAA+ superfamily ATPase